jgi:hypothetical protein
VLAAAVAALGENGEARRADINDTLRALAHPDGAPLLQYGVVGSEQIGNLALFAGAPEPVVRRVSPRATPKQPPNDGDESASPTGPVAKIDLRALRSLERKAAAAKSGSQRADAALGAARTALAAAKEAVAAATTAAAQARADAREAVAAVDQLRDQAR